MASYLAKGVAVWIPGFLTFLARLNALDAVVQWDLEDREGVIEPYLVGNFIGIRRPTNRSMLESTQISLYQRLENNERAREELLNKINVNLHDVRDKTLDALEKQGIEIQKIREDLFSAIETNVGALGEEILSVPVKQMTELTNVGARLKRLERKLLTSQADNSKKLRRNKGIGPQGKNRGP